ncbi:MAG: hypothetical protein JSS14_14760 [Proteobacteria bacterium]|nr:hypothetical protein [Pseudomonadota bacterium]
MASNFHDRLGEAAQLLLQAGSRRIGPRIGTMSGKPIHDFIDGGNGTRWLFDGRNYAGRILADSDIVDHEAVYALVP